MRRGELRALPPVAVAPPAMLRQLIRREMRVEDHRRRTCARIRRAARRRPGCRTRDPWRRRCRPSSRARDTPARRRDGSAESTSARTGRRSQLAAAEHLDFRPVGQVIGRHGEERRLGTSCRASPHRAVASSGAKIRGRQPGRIELRQKRQPLQMIPVVVREHNREVARRAGKCTGRCRRCRSRRRG